MHVCMCVFLRVVQCVFLRALALVCAYAISSAREKARRGGESEENDPGADTYETGGLIHKHGSEAPGPGNLRGKLLTSQPWRPYCLLCMRSCDML